MTTKTLEKPSKKYHFNDKNDNGKELWYPKEYLIWSQYHLPPYDSIDRFFRCWAKNFKK